MLVLKHVFGTFTTVRSCMTAAQLGSSRPSVSSLLSPWPLLAPPAPLAHTHAYVHVWLESFLTASTANDNCADAARSDCPWRVAVRMFSGSATSTMFQQGPVRSRQQGTAVMGQSNAGSRRLCCSTFNCRLRSRCFPVAPSLRRLSVACRFGNQLDQVRYFAC